jgi:hypothetical protein
MNISPPGQNSVVVAIQKTEVESQLDVAHKYPRKISVFIDEAKAMIQRSTDVAEMCFYSLPRKDRDGNPIQIMGPSVRLAEIAASAYENLHVGARPLDVGPTDTDCVSQGVVWDLQKNVRYTIECRRRITYKNGGQYNADMITMTQNAASSIALRNAIFRVIPRAYIDELYNHARSVAVGDARAIGERRQKVVAKLIKMGTTEERILAKVGREDVEQITAEDLETLIGIGTSIKEKMSTVDEQFPKLASEEPTRGGADKYLANKKTPTGASKDQGKRKRGGGQKKAPAQPQTQQKPAESPPEQSSRDNQLPQATPPVAGPPPGPAETADLWSEVQATAKKVFKDQHANGLRQLCKEQGFNDAQLSEQQLSILLDILIERAGM